MALQECATSARPNSVRERRKRDARAGAVKLEVLDGGGGADVVGPDQLRAREERVSL